MGESSARDDFLLNNGTPYIDADGDLCPGNVGGQVLVINFHGVVDATETATAFNCGGATATQVAMPKAGSIVGLTVHASSVCAGGNATITVYNGTVAYGTITCAFNTTTGVTRTYTTWVNKDLYTFEAGDLLSAKHKNTGYENTSTHSVALFVEI